MPGDGKREVSPLAAVALAAGVVWAGSILVPVLFGSSLRDAGLTYTHTDRAIVSGVGLYLLFAYGIRVPEPSA